MEVCIGMDKTVFPGSLHGTLPILPSKSASHRAVMLAAMARERTDIAPLQLSRDIQATLACAQALGLTDSVSVAQDESSGFMRARICGGEPSRSPRAMRTLDCGESGSTLRFFIPLALDGRGPVRFVGHGRLMQRPLDVYEQLFVPGGMTFAREGDFLTVEGELRSGEYALRGDVSSQFITGLLLALPRLAGDSTLTLVTPLESRPYVELTRRAQAAFGIVSHWEESGRRLRIPGGQAARSPGSLHVEGDWSHAAFYLTAGVIGRAGPVTLTGLDPRSAQGDRAIVTILRGMGAEIREESGRITAFPSRLHGLRVDVSQLPDLVPVLAVAMACAQGESRITGAARLRIKESDRLRAIRHALNAAGADVTEQADGLIVHGGHPFHAACIDGCNDHRIVMAMAVAGTVAQGGLTLQGAEAAAKSAPAFWEEFASLGGIAR